MADSKITDLTALTGASVDTVDVLEVTDISDTTMDASGTSKKMTANELAIAMATTLGVVGRDKLWDTKGDLAVATGADTAAKLAVGTDGQILQADSTQTAGVAWKSRGRVVSRTTTDTTFSNSTAANVIATQAIPTSAAAGDVFHLTVVGDLTNNSGGAVTFTFTVVLGATTVVTSNAVSAANSSAVRQFRFDIDVLVVATNDERVSVDTRINTATNGFVLGTATSSGAGRGTATEDLTAGKNLAVTCAMGTANASASITAHEAFLEVTKA